MESYRGRVGEVVTEPLLPGRDSAHNVSGLADVILL